MNNNETNKATVKVVRQQIHEINDFKMLNNQLKGENKKLWVLLQVATKEIVDLKVEVVEDLKRSLEFLILTKSNNTIHKLISKWEAKKL